MGGAREPGSSMLLEDVACETSKLGAMSKDIIAIFRKYNHPDACLMGHALEGNLHLIFNQSFKDDTEMARANPNTLTPPQPEPHNSNPNPDPDPNASPSPNPNQARYEGIMQDLCETVALKYGGSLKAEHGTGRNVAPFVEMEWGTKAYELMWEVTLTPTLTLTLTLTLTITLTPTLTLTPTSTPTPTLTLTQPGEASLRPGVPTQPGRRPQRRP